MTMNFRTHYDSLIFTPVKSAATPVKTPPEADNPKRDDLQQQPDESGVYW
ncbi:hypothetical protein [Pseudoalteromonas sp. J010]|nr:hypothetical protein [Pseudoalteromonas sp. J010]